jgi:hypothetical protein
MPWTRSGTVSVAQNSTTVTGTGTDFAANTRVGDAFVGPDGRQYEITNAASATVISILPAYAGPTLAAGNYAIVPIQGYNKATADALRQASLEVGDALDGMEESVAAAAASALAATAARDSAAGYRDSASTSAAAADDSEAQALSYRDAAQGYASTATTQAGNAGTARTAAEAARDLTLGYRDNASASASAAAASAAAANGVGAGYIQGLIPTWNSTSSITFSAGTAVIQSTGKALRVTSPITLSALTGLSADVFYYAYLYDNAGTPAVEFSTTAPAAPFSGSACSKAGDASRRFIGAFRTASGGGIYPFRISNGILWYCAATNNAPFRVLAAATSTSFTTFSVASVVPPTTRTALLRGLAVTGTAGLTNALAAAAYMGLYDPSSRYLSEFPLSDDRSLIYVMVTAGNFTVDILGYGMDR